MFLPFPSPKSPSKPSPFKSVKAELVYKSKRLEAPPHEQSRAAFLYRTPPFRINLIVSDGDILYYAYSSSHLARYRIHRSNGIILKALPAIRISPPTTINNIRIAEFEQCHGGRLLLMTGGSELTTNNGTLSILQLPPRCNDNASQSDDLDTSSVAHTFTLPVLSAWGLGIHEERGLIAVSSNSRAVTLLTTIASRQSIFDSMGDDEEYEGYDASEAASQIQIVPIADALQDTHWNNIPSVAFSHDGNLVATASIDTTFAISDIRPSKERAVLAGLNHFVQQLSGRELIQIGQRVDPSGDARRTTGRAWLVHWISDSLVSYLGRGVGIPDTPSLDHARQRWASQRLRGPWIPNTGGLVKSPDIFQPYDEPIEQSDHVLLYDDRVDELPSDVWDSEDIGRVKKSSSDVGHAVTSEQSTDPPNEMGSQNRNNSRFGKRMEQGESRSGNGKSLLLVCYEGLIELYEVNDNLSQLSDEELLCEEDVKLLDSVHYPGIYGRQMITNAIEIPALRALLVVGTGSGVLLIRIVTGIASDREHVVRRGGHGKGKFSLFVEEVFEAGADVAGTCVVERKGDSVLTHSFELWILKLNGHVECWDLSTPRSVIDPSCLV